MNNLRGINNSLLTAFKASVLYPLVRNNPKEFLCCIRNNAIGIYYNADRVAMVTLNKKGKLCCKTSSYYLSDYCKTKSRSSEKSSEITLTPEDIVKNIETIKANSELRSTPEKKAQQALVYANNSNPNSEWICIDIEYRQSTKVQDGGMFHGRFDIIVVSKSAKHRVAIIELKYNHDALGGTAGVVKHVEDFYLFNNWSVCYSNLKKEICVCGQNLADLGLLPESAVIKEEANDFPTEPEFYMICLYDDEISTKGTVGGYLFKDKRKDWGTKRISKNNNAMTKLEGTYMGKCFDVESKKCAIKIDFLFKKTASPASPGVNNILDKDQYDECK